MALVNPHRIFFINSDRQTSRHQEVTINCEYRLSTTGTMLRDWDDKDYFYLEYRQANCFNNLLLDELMMPHELEALRNGNLTLVLNNAHEAFHLPVEQFYKSLVIKQNIPAENILLMTESADIAKEIDRCAELFNKPKMKADWILQFEFNMKRDVQTNWKNADRLPILELKHYDKKFLNFNRRWRPHRPMLVALFKSFDLLKYGHVSLGKNDQNIDWERTASMLLTLSSSHPELSQIIKDIAESLKTMPDLYLDTENLMNNQAHLSYQTQHLYADTLVSIVSETNFYDIWGLESARFLSEKTFKPIAMGHPFIIASVPNMLTKLKELGYQTFSPFIDESYDTETNDNERILKIAKEVQRIANFTQCEVESFINAVRPICEHNKRVLLNKEKFVHKLNY